MTTFETMRRLVAWRRAEFAWNVAAWSVCHMIPLAYGILVKAIFDALSGGAAAGLNAWTVLAILAVAYGSRQGALIFGFRLFSRYYLAVQAYLKRNMLEYLMLAGVNDSGDDARELAAWLAGLDVHVNLIPYNPIVSAPHLRSTERPQRDAFAAALRAAGFVTTIRYSLGADIAAACGQLVQRENREIARRQVIFTT